MWPNIIRRFRRKVNTILCALCSYRCMSHQFLRTVEITEGIQRILASILFYFWWSLFANDMKLIETNLINIAQTGAMPIKLLKSWWNFGSCEHWLSLQCKIVLRINICRQLMCSFVLSITKLYRIELQSKQHALYAKTWFHIDDIFFGRLSIFGLPHFFGSSADGIVNKVDCAIRVHSQSFMNFIKIVLAMDKLKRKTPRTTHVRIDYCK